MFLYQALAQRYVIQRITRRNVKKTTTTTTKHKANQNKTERGTKLKKKRKIEK